MCRFIAEHIQGGDSIFGTGYACFRCVTRLDLCTDRTFFELSSTNCGHKPYVDTTETETSVTAILEGIEKVFRSGHIVAVSYLIQIALKPQLCVRHVKVAFVVFRWGLNRLGKGEKHQRNVIVSTLY